MSEAEGTKGAEGAKVAEAVEWAKGGATPPGGLPLPEIEGLSGEPSQQCEGQGGMEGMAEGVAEGVADGKGCRPATGDGKAEGMTRSFNHRLLAFVNILHQYRGLARSKRTNTLIFPGLKGSLLILSEQLKCDAGTDSFIRPIAEWANSNEGAIRGRDEKVFLQPNSDFLRDTMQSAKLWNTLSLQERKFVWKRVAKLADLALIYRHLNCREGAGPLNREMFSIVEGLLPLVPKDASPEDLLKVALESGLVEKITKIVRNNPTDNLLDFVQQLVAILQPNPQK